MLQSLWYGQSSCAVPIPIVGYDVFETPASPFFGWEHTYSGTITPTNLRTIAGFAIQFQNETGGSGTLNDGIFGNLTNSQLFATTDDSGAVFSPSIVLHLGSLFQIDEIRLFGGPEENTIPGRIEGVTVDIGGASQTFATTPFGPPSTLSSIPINDLLTITGTGLEGVVTDTIILSDFSGNFFSVFGQEFSLTEIEVDGTVAVVPEPVSFLLLGSGLMGIVLIRRKGKIKS